jgi:hypothetical protein
MMPSEVSGRSCLMVTDGTQVWLDVHVKVLAELLNKHVILEFEQVLNNVLQQCRGI